ncbi:hypothetical protein AAZX31_08G266300 [Glycine max]|uniref:Legume lectin domain-containing protein n=3 Tax=Glycine subgen. Soja TaxID=1462606 RepID=I1KX48_SOYBN|nr:agglutinin-2-like [Glycine soja]KAG5017071.1 hypothetical protein JHK85_023207 [Glycine max]KAG5001547.1 hypothetical protein JHK87_022619 [Glycine soja]KAG5026827.1 hypothetical protein JHK86_022741 [Glycine max]KAG5137984.1 hypothetical protein JHK82_022715 [Glycine max]KAH1053367.1 hypothetical protein GYH30_022588 [Glycine max]|eukprot:XP_003530580.1 agglutinin-2 [Glycine max]
MVLSNSKPFFLLLVQFLMLHRNWDDTSFNFPNFSGPYPNTVLTFQGDARIIRGVIDPTNFVKNAEIVPSAGRATYALPVRLWDSKSGKVASFTTTFSFKISNGPNTGDGIAFFLAPFGSNMPRDSAGGYLGLFSRDTALRNTNKNHIVAVEFDMHQNEWDPAATPHIGIDVNSISSVATVRWEIEELGVPTVSATVSYDSKTQIFGMALNDGTVVAYEIDLRTVLPEFVSVGFSGATGVLIEDHEILSWTFSSSFD